MLDFPLAFCKLYTHDKYFADDEAKKSFYVVGKEITAKLLAEALDNLSRDTFVSCCSGRQDSVLSAPSFLYTE